MSQTKTCKASYSSENPVNMSRLASILTAVLQLVLKCHNTKLHITRKFWCNSLPWASCSAAFRSRLALTLWVLSFQYLDAVSAFDVGISLDTLPKFLRVRVHRLSAACPNALGYLAPVLAMETYCFNEALMLLIVPVSVTFSTFVLGESWCVGHWCRLYDYVNCTFWLFHGLSVSLSNLLNHVRSVICLQCNLIWALDFFGSVLIHINATTWVFWSIAFLRLNLFACELWLFVLRCVTLFTFSDTSISWEIPIDADCRS